MKFVVMNVKSFLVAVYRRRFETRNNGGSIERSVAQEGVISRETVHVARNTHVVCKMQVKNVLVDNHVSIKKRLHSQMIMLLCRLLLFPSSLPSLFYGRLIHNVGDIDKNKH
jgi:hypothetical protein